MPAICLARRLINDAASRLRAVAAGYPRAGLIAFEPCSHCGAASPDEVARRCISFNRDCFEAGEPCHGESPR